MTRISDEKKIQDHKKDNLTPGFYWAKTKGSHRWWNLIIRVHGRKPFYKIEGWRREFGGVDNTCGEIQIEDISQIGDEIIEPQVLPYSDEMFFD